VLGDNFAYLLIEKGSGKCAVVDPAGAEKVIREVKERNLILDMVLTTHHHLDHAGGNSDLLRLLSVQIPVYGGDDRIQAISHILKDEQILTLGEIQIKVLASPCHTTGHVLYLCNSPSDSRQILFTGDTLFVGGCGRFFEGTAKQMNHALNSLVAGLRDDTLVYCGHEYALNNLGFGLSVEPNNPELIAKIEQTKKLLQEGRHSVPSTVAEEKSYNPFMRLHSPEIRLSLGLGHEAPDVDVMAALRQRKNNWKG